MRMSRQSEEMFGPAIARAKSRGMTHFAKVIGYPFMRFGASIEQAEKKAHAAARRIYCVSHPGKRYACSVQSGEI